LAEAIALAAEGRVRPEVSTARLEEVNRVFADLKAGRVNGRVVMMM
jgi:propanol-preferring alcohol dehydrogenase